MRALLVGAVPVLETKLVCPDKNGWPGVAAPHARELRVRAAGDVVEDPGIAALRQVRAVALDDLQRDLGQLLG